MTLVSACIVEGASETARPVMRTLGRTELEEAL
jgi:hypothetical protein